MSTSISATEIGLPDNAKLKLGTGEDLELYHDGSGSFIVDSGTGDLHIRASDDLKFETADGSETYLLCNQNSSVDLYHDNSKKFETFADGIKVVDDGSVVEIELITNSSSVRGKVTADSGNQVILATATDENMLIAKADGAVELYHDNSKKFETISGGVAVTGALDMADGNFLNFGGGGLKIRTNANNAYITEATSGKLLISASNLELGNTALSKTYAYFTDGGSAQLYYNNTNRFETTSDGALVSGRLAIGALAANNKINVLGAAGNNQTTLYYGFGTIDLTSASDERVKNNVVPTAKGLDDILKLRIVDFTYTPEYAEDFTTVRTGGIAQEWQKVDPNLVNTENEDLLFIEYKRVIPHLIKALQEAVVRIEALEAA